MLPEYKPEWLLTSQITDRYGISRDSCYVAVYRYRTIHNTQEVEFYKSSEDGMLFDIGYFKYMNDMRNYKYHLATHTEYRGKVGLYWILNEYYNDWSLSKILSAYTESSVSAWNAFLSYDMWAIQDLDKISLTIEPRGGHKIDQFLMIGSGIALLKGNDNEN